MPLYEYPDKSENKVHVSAPVRRSLVVGPQAVIAALLAGAQKEARRLKRGVTVALDGWYGVPWAGIAARLKAAAARSKIELVLVDANSLFKGQAELASYKQPFISDDPCFGVVNDKGRIADLMDAAKVAELSRRLKRHRHTSDRSILVVFGSGSAAPALAGSYDRLAYFDKTRQPLLWQMWDGKLATFGSDKPRADYSWKEYYYCDFYLLEAQKHFCFERMDYWVEGIEIDQLKLLPRKSYDLVMSELVKQPIKEVKIFQPGPWGAYRYQHLWKVPGLGCNAWNELAGPELSMLVDIGGAAMLNMPFTNLLQYGPELVGPVIHRELPGMFPLDIWLDDGYFPKPTPAERISMPIHNHPSTDYVKKHFNEPLGRYETYYIAEAYEGANTWMGFNETADLEAWERKCRESERTGKPIPDWKDFIANHSSNVGDLYLIPPGTTHGHGGNQMVLEMDTVPSVAGTEYSFFTYDFARPSWNDKTKTMTGKPVRMHLDHGFDMDQGRRSLWVKDNLRAKASVVKWTKEYSLDRYSSYGPMPFEIERFHFRKRAHNDTLGRFMNIVTLTVGEKVLIRSVKHPKRQTEIEWFQSAVIPACYGAYELINLGGGQATCVQIRWKKG